MQPPKPGAPATHAAPTVRVARPANTTRTRLVVSPRPPAPTAAAPPAAPAQGSAGGLGNGVPPVVAKFQLPQKSFSITAKQIEETINLKDPEDAVKYMPSLFVRKRNDGDNQAVLATRTWGLNSSARTLIYLDDLLISALIGNNNSGASPHWNLVSPESIARIDFLNGPYAAAYPGNSIGGVLLITTKMPDKFEATAKETVSIQPWSQYGTQEHLHRAARPACRSETASATVAWLFSANYLRTASTQPLTYTTNGSATGGNDRDHSSRSTSRGVVADVVGTGALIHTQQTAANLKLAYDVLARRSVGPTRCGHLEQRPDLEPADLSDVDRDRRADVRRRLELREQRVHVESDAHEQCGIVQERHPWRVRFRSLGVELQLPAGHPCSTPTPSRRRVSAYSQNGKITRNDGTNWQNADAKRIWRPVRHGCVAGNQLRRPRRPLLFRQSGLRLVGVEQHAVIRTGQLYSDGIGETRTGALWAAGCLADHSRTSS